MVIHIPHNHVIHSSLSLFRNLLLEMHCSGFFTEMHPPFARQLSMIKFVWWTLAPPSWNTFLLIPSDFELNQVFPSSYRQALAYREAAFAEERARASARTAATAAATAVERADAAAAARQQLQSEREANDWYINLMTLLAWNINIECWHSSCRTIQTRKLLENDNINSSELTLSHQPIASILSRLQHLSLGQSSSTSSLPELRSHRLRTVREGAELVGAEMSLLQVTDYIDNTVSSFCSLETRKLTVCALRRRCLRVCQILQHNSRKSGFYIRILEEEMKSEVQNNSVNKGTHWDVIQLNFFPNKTSLNIIMISQINRINQ